jgi:hypothetical protein
MSKNAKRETPIVNAVLAWVKTLIPKAQHEAAERGAQSIVAEQDGFVRNGNRTDYNRDAEAFASAGIEHTKDGAVLVYSNMEKRRAHDIIRTALFQISEALYPPVPQKNTNADGTPKMNHRKGEREKWITSLGFAKVEVGKGSRYVLATPGSEELIAKVEALVPERFDGTKAPENTKKSVIFILPARLQSRTVAVSLYDPESAKVDAEKFTTDLTQVRMLLEDGWNLKDTEARVSKLYLDGLAAQNREKQPEAAAAAA